MKAQEIIKEIMKEEGLSQNAMASMLVTSRSTLKTVLLPDRNMMTDTVYKYVKVLKGEVVIGGNVMTNEYDEKMIVRDMMRKSRMSQTALCEAAGYSSRGSIRMVLLNKTSIRMDALVRIVGAMGGKVIIRYKGNEWEVS